MRLINHCLSFLTIAALFSSCSQETPWGNATGEGKIRLRLAADSDVKSAAPKLRAVSTDVVAPPVDDFQIRLTKTDGSYAKTWSSVSEFLEETEFTVGTYEIEAFYGNPNAQGTITEEQDGYEYAYYYGKTTDITVLEGQTTDVQLHAELANSIIVIEYSDAFKNYFADWQTTLQTDGNSPVILGGAEAMNYVIPGNVGITISAEQQNGKTLTLKPGEFTAEPQHMYKMRYNIYNGEIGGVDKDKLVIEFDDNLLTEPIEVDLSDELQNAAAPVVTPTGFENGQSFANLSGTPFDGEIKFNVVARGRIAEANLTIESDTYKADFLKDGVIDLCSATQDQKDKMAAAGIIAIGFFKNPGEMAQLDLTALCRSLPEGNHKFIFQVVDKYQQTNEPVDVTVASIPVEVAVEPISAPFGEGYADIRISYNGPDPTTPSSNPFSFQVAGDGAYVACEVLSIGKEEATRSFESHDYIYRIAIPTAQRDELPLRTYFNGIDNEMKDLRTNIPYQYPDYQMEYDPMAKSLRMRTSFGDAVKNKRFIHKLRVFVDNNEIPENRILRNDVSGILSISGFEPSSTYTVQTTLQSKDTPSEFGSTAQLTTEQALQIPNGDFSDKTTTIDKNIEAGGKYKYGATEMINHTHLLIEEPTGWASINQKTCYLNSNPLNTWFAVPSTLMRGNEVLIRSVAYDHNGKMPDLDNHSLNVRAKYSRNKPTSWSSYAAGELFLGSYSYNGSETRNEGIAFSGRPVSLSFDYRYTSVNGEVGDVEVILLDDAGKSIVSKTETIATSTTNPNTNDTKTINFAEYAFGSKVASIKLKFRSSTAATPAAPVPSDIQDVTNTTGLSGQTIDQDKYKSLCTGSQLTISNVRLNY